ALERFSFTKTLRSLLHSLTLLPLSEVCCLRATQRSGARENPSSIHDIRPTPPRAARLPCGPSGRTQEREIDVETHRSVDSAHRCARRESRRGTTGLGQRIRDARRVERLSVRAAVLPVGRS